MFAYDSSLLGLLDAIVGTYKRPLAFLIGSFLFFFLPSFHDLSSSFILCFLLWRPLILTASRAVEGGAWSHSYRFSSALGSRQVHSSRSQSAANGMTLRNQREVEITHFCTKHHTFNQLLLFFSLGPRGSVGLRVSITELKLTLSSFTYTPCLLRQGKPSLLHFLYIKWEDNSNYPSGC